MFYSRSRSKLARRSGTQEETMNTRILSALTLWLCTAALVISCAPASPFSMGLEYDRTGQHELAVSAFTESIALDPNSPAPRNSRGISYMKLGERRKALEDFEEAIRLDPNYAFAYHSRGILYATEFEDLERAVSDFDRCIELTDGLCNAPSAPSCDLLESAYRNRGMARSRMGAKEGACKDWLEACGIRTGGGGCQLLARERC
jgi:tetratricopeptide (TPR) repeat protein